MRAGRDKPQPNSFGNAKKGPYSSFIFDFWLHRNSCLKFVRPVDSVNFLQSNSSYEVCKVVSEGHPITPAPKTTPQHSMCTCQSFHMLNSQSRIVEGQACQSQRGDGFYDLGNAKVLLTPSSFKNANYLDWSDIWKMFLQPKPAPHTDKELGDTAMGLGFSPKGLKSRNPRKPCGLTV